ncbi:MAG: Gfo/Idh/MocA family oxidoreductase [Calditrichaeota bacterium]|nr:Gfo/Idh/MocA family oxidoreductase [Calditrichota bacterium]
MPGNKIRIGIVGAGTNTKLKHIPGLQAIEGVEIISVCNRSAESSERVAGEFAIAKVFDNWRQVVDDPQVDAIVIGTWPYMHCRITLAALQANKHVLCEARMAMNAAEAHAMLSASQNRPDIVTQIVPSPMTLRVDKTIKRLLADDYIGDVLAVNVIDGTGSSDPNTPFHWRLDFDLSGYNTMSLGIWYEAIMRWLGEATNVVAKGKVFTKMRRDQFGELKAVKIPEHLGVVADMACGAQAHFQLSSVTGFAGPAMVYLFGNKGTLLFTENKLYGAKQGDKKLQEIDISQEFAGGWRVEEEFINAIRGTEKITHTTFEDGVKYMEFTEAVIKSMQLRREITLPL